MGANNKEREYENWTLSDKDIVKYLILYRSKIDAVYGSYTNIDIHQAGDVFEFNTELIVLYASLDNVIKLCKFKEKQINLLNLLFKGYTIQDICAMNIGYKRSATYDLFDRMIIKIVDMNYSEWKSTI